MNNVVNAFGLPTGPTGTNNGEREYRPVDLDRKGEVTRIEIRLSNGRRYALPYAVLVNILDFGPHAPEERQGEAMLLLFSIGQIILDGRNLHLPLPHPTGDDTNLTLFDVLRDERVRVLYPYDPALYDQPPESMPVITAITLEPPASPSAQNELEGGAGDVSA